MGVSPKLGVPFKRLTGVIHGHIGFRHASLRFPKN